MVDILYVNEKDEVIGSGPKKEALKKGIAHRIVRIFIFNSKGQLLIQKRADHLTSAPGKWDLSASGHVDVGEDTITAAKRELYEETGITHVDLTETGKFFSEKKTTDEIKKRFNTIYTGTYEGQVVPNHDAVSEMRWIDSDELEKWMANTPNDFIPSVLTSFKLLQNSKS